MSAYTVYMTAEHRRWLEQVSSQSGLSMSLVVGLLMEERDQRHGGDLVKVAESLVKQARGGRRMGPR